MFRFIHAADIHLDSPLSGLERKEEAPIDLLRGATRQAFENLVDLAITESIQFVLLVGDLYDGDWRDYNTGLFFHRQMIRLRDANIQVFRIKGNHDAESEITKHLKLPDNVIDFDTKHPETKRINGDDIVIHGQSFGERDEKRNLAEAYPMASSGAFNIGMLHTALTGREGHDRYAPCTKEDLLSRRYQYWALGHVHAREIVNTDPYIVFPGNTQGRHIREIGSKGCSIVTVHSFDAVEVEHRPLDVLRWERCWVDAHSCIDGDMVKECTLEQLNKLLKAHPQHPLAVRVEISGASKAHDDLQRHRDDWVASLRADVMDVSSGRAWLEKVALDTRSEVSRDALAAQDSPLGNLLLTLDQLTLEHPAIVAVREEFDALCHRLPEDLFLGKEGEDLRLRFQPEMFDRLRLELNTLLLPRLRASMEDGR